MEEQATHGKMAPRGKNLQSESNQRPCLCGLLELTVA
jgi:hypothetical protein